MKISVLTVGSMGDVRPYVALGYALQSNGFEVTIATHQEFAGLITAFGMRFHEIPSNPREMLHSPEGQALLKTGTDIRKFAERMREAARPSFGAIADSCLAASEGADAIVLSFLTIGLGAMIARKTGVRTIAGFLQPMTPTGAFPTMTLPTLYLGGFLNRLSHHLTREIFWHVFRPLLEAWSLERLGLKPPRLSAYKWAEKRSLVLNGFSRMLVPRPNDWPANVHVTGYWLLPEGEDWQTPEVLSDFLAAGPPPIYVGFGSMSGDDPARLTNQIITAIQASGQRGILLGGWGGLVDQNLPPEILHIQGVPHDWLFPRMKAVVHHGGAGTTHAGLAAGVPSLGLPFFGDQLFWSQRLFGMGAGPRPITQDKLEQTALNETFKALASNPRYAQRASELGQRMRSEGGTREAVVLVKKFMESKR